MRNRKTYICGDIHGQFNPFIWDILTKLKLENADVIVVGDVGMGFHKLNYYIDTFKTINKKLSKADVHVYFIRGNHDNPDYFNNPDKSLTDFSHIHLVRDYTVLHLNGHNILCVGGASSIDKAYRIPGKDWWEFENVLQYEKLNCKDIDTVVTHCAPIFCNPSWEKLSWMDEDLNRISKQDRIILAEMYFDLIKSNNKVNHWIYGHYHNHYICSLENDINEFTDYSIGLLVNGSVLPLETEEANNENICTFIGLNMLDKQCDLYELK